MSWSEMMSQAQAERIAKLQVSDIVTIQNLERHSQKAEDILRIAREIRSGGEPAIAEGVLETGPRPIHIIAPSFVKDRGQYHDTHGISDERANEIAKLLRSDPKTACEQILELVNASQKARGKQRSVLVHMTAAPSDKEGSIGATLPADGRAGELSAEVARNSAICGLYQFESTPTGLADHAQFGSQYQYGVHLGDGLFAIGQSKKVVVAAARLCRVKGRFAKVIEPYIFFWVAGSLPVRGDMIPDSLWDGKQHASEPIKPWKMVETEAMPLGTKRTIDESELLAEGVD